LVSILTGSAQVTRVMAVAAQKDLVCGMAVYCRPGRNGWFNSVSPDDLPEGLASGLLFSQPRKNPDQGKRARVRGKEWVTVVGMLAVSLTHSLTKNSLTLSLPDLTLTHSLTD
jgi:hypothetical protein